MDLTERKAQTELARWFNCYAQLVVPSVFFAGGEMDLAVVTRTGYLSEIEIKLSVSDWNADRLKAKWTHADRALVAKFFYAVPLDLVERAPEWVPTSAGILAFTSRGIREVRKAVRNKAAPKLTAEHRNTLLESTYWRYWRAWLAEQAA